MFSEDQCSVWSQESPCSGQVADSTVHQQPLWWWKETSYKLLEENGICAGLAWKYCLNRNYIFQFPVVITLLSVLPCRQCCLFLLCLW